MYFLMKSPQSTKNVKMYRLLLQVVKADVGGINNSLLCISDFLFYVLFDDRQ